MSDRATEIAALLAPTVASLQLELLGVEFVASGSHALLRLYIDVEGRPVTIDDCELVSREVSGVLDVHDPITSRYELEVSSPGIDRPLFTPEQFARHLGEEAKLSLQIPVEGRRRIQGRIGRVEGESIVLRVGEAEVAIAHPNIEKARLVPDWAALGFAPSPKPGAGKKKTGKSAKKKSNHGAGRPPVTEHEQ